MLLSLPGIRQYYDAAAYNPQKAYDNKVKQLTRLLSSVNFHQCLVFSNYQMRSVTEVASYMFVMLRFRLVFVSDHPFAEPVDGHTRL